MSPLAATLTILIAIGAVVLVVALVRARRLKERYALIWLLVAFGMLLLAVTRPFVDSISRFLGIQSGTTTLFLVAILVLVWQALDSGASHRVVRPAAGRQGALR